MQFKVLNPLKSNMVKFTSIVTETDQVAVF